MTVLRLSYSICSANSFKSHPTGINPCYTPRSSSLTVSCQTEKGTVGSSSNRVKGEDENRRSKQPESVPPPLSFLMRVVKMGDDLKESLSPKQKGDWKDVVLMSLSFAVYVYMSQKLVCAYCAWTSMVKHSSW